eukprot:12329751-Alexandrium_andersonii.AAC.1
MSLQPPPPGNERQLFRRPWQRRQRWRLGALPRRRRSPLLRPRPARRVAAVRLVLPATQLRPHPFLRAISRAQLTRAD